MTASPEPILFQITPHGNVEVPRPELRALIMKRLQGIQSLAREAADSTDPRVVALAAAVISEQFRELQGIAAQ